MTSSKRLRITALAVAGLAALQLAWIAVMVPYFGIDEFDHGLRASSVAAGHWEAGGQPVPAHLGRGDLISVRSDVAAAAKPACRARPYTGPWNCNAVRSDGPGRVLIASAASNYNPSYYAIAGTVASPWHGNANLMAMRVVTALLSLFFFGLAVWVVLGISRTTWPLAGLLAAALPTTVYSSAVAAPNGVEIFAGIALWACVIALVEGVRTGRDRATAYLGTAVAGIAVANTHTLGLLWCGLTALVVLGTYGVRRTIGTLRPRRTSEYVAALALAAGFAFELVWILTSGVNNPETASNSVTVSPWPTMLQGAILWPLQGIGAIPLRDNPAPLLTIALFATVLLALVIGATHRAGLRSHRIRACLTVLALSWLVPAALTWHTFHQVGAIWQGRYASPFTAGAFLFAGLALDRAPALKPRLVAVLLAGGTVAVTVAHLTALISLTRIQAQLHTLVAQTGWSQPSLLLLLLGAAISGGCWWVAVRRVPVLDESRHPEGAEAHDRRLAAVLR